MNRETEPVYIGNCEDVDKGSVENFEHEELDYAIYHLESGFFSSQGHCNCEEQSFLSEANVEGEEVECSSCGNTYSIVSGDCISNPEDYPLKIYDISIENDNIFLNL